MPNSKIPNIGVHHIALSVSDYDKSKSFYTEGLGFSVYAEWGDEKKRACLLDIGSGSYFELFSNGTAEPASNEKLVHIALATSDPDAAYQIAMAAGAVSHIEPKDVTLHSARDLPIRVAFVRGFNGEVIEFFKEL